MPLDAKELAKEKELNRELSDEEMDRLLIPRRSVGTWMTFGLILLGLVGGAGYFFGARVLKAGRNYAAEVAAVGTTEQRQAAQQVLEDVNNKLTLWKLQHQGRLPSFDEYPDWELLTGATDISGKLSPGRGVPVCGPYMSAKPVNPINNRSGVYSIEGKATLNEPLPGGAKAGFVYSKTLGRFWMTDVAGTRPIDPTAPYTGGGTAPAPAPAAAPASTPAPAGKPADAVAETPDEKGVEKPMEKPAERMTEKPVKPVVSPAPTRATEPTRTVAPERSTSSPRTPPAKPVATEKQTEKVTDRGQPKPRK